MGTDEHPIGGSEKARFRLWTVEGLGRVQGSGEEVPVYKSNFNLQRFFYKWSIVLGECLKIRIVTSGSVERASWHYSST